MPVPIYGNWTAVEGVKSVMRRYSVFTLLVLMLALAACGNGASSGGSTAPVVPPGTITGSVVGFKSGDRSSTTPEANIAVEAYTRSFPYIGPVTPDRPHPVAGAVTDARGHFQIDGLMPGHRYFLLFGMSTAKWVQLGTDHGATVSATVCTDCPLPM